MHFLTDYSYLSTSDYAHSHFLMMNFRNNRRDFFIPYASEETTAIDYGGSTLLTSGSSQSKNFRGLRLLSLAGLKFTQTALVEATGGAHFFSHSGLNYILPVGEIKAYLSFLDLISGYVSLGYDYAYLLGLTPGSVNDTLKSTNINLYVNVKPTNDLMFNYRQKTNLLSDGNSRSVIDVESLYAISSFDPWIWAGLGLEYLSFKNETNSYWSPLSVISFGPRLDSSIAFLAEYFRFNAAFDYNYSYESANKSSGMGYKYSVSLTVGERNSTNGSVFYNKVSTPRSAGRWSSNEVGAQVNLFL